MEQNYEECQRLSAISKNLLNKSNSKEFTSAEFLTECAYWALRDGFEELKPYNYPTRPQTEAFIEYQNLPPKQKSRLDQTFFNNNQEIMEYYSKLHFVKNKNKHNLSWLEEVKSYLPERDFIAMRKVNERILEFKAFMDNETKEIQSAKDIFMAKRVKEGRYSYAR